MLLEQFQEQIGEYTKYPVRFERRIDFNINGLKKVEDLAKKYSAEYQNENSGILDGHFGWL